VAAALAFAGFLLSIQAAEELRFIWLDASQ